MQKILVTGSAGFIGFHLSRILLEEGYEVCGFDGMTKYYDVALKEARNAILKKHANYRFCEGMLEDAPLLEELARDFAPDVIVHLAAQAGVRYSLEEPRAYINANIVGTFNIMEIARQTEVAHLLMASTSSVYGSNPELPFVETHKADTPLTIYAATKKASEAMGHSYAHLWKLPITMFRFFTVFGPWGRPDMALFKFVDAILKDRPIDIYNNGEMYRDFTYVTDLVQAIRLLIDHPPLEPKEGETIPDWDSLSPVAPFRTVNIGNSDKVRLLDFVDAIEAELGVTAKRNYMPMQKGDVPATWADATLLQQLTGYRPKTDFRDGVAEFVAWYRDFYGR